MIWNVLKRLAQTFSSCVSATAQHVSNFTGLGRLRTMRSIAYSYVPSGNSSVVVSPHHLSTLPSHFSTSSSGVYKNYCCENSADGISTAHSIETVFGIPSSSMVIFVGNTSINMNDSVTGDICLLHDSVTRPLVPDVVIDACSR